MQDDCDSLHTLAGAFCLMAAGAHSKDVGEQEQIAPSFYNSCCTGFEGVRVNDAVTAFVEGLMKKAKKK